MYIPAACDMSTGYFTGAVVRSSSTTSTRRAILRSNLPCSSSSSNLTLKSSRLKISHTTTKAPPKYVFPIRVFCLNDDDSEASPESAGATIDIKLPRRSLLVYFTCNACGARSKRLINRLAYEKGTVFLQCSGCSQYHKLVDNLNLVVEYDFRDEENSITSDDA